MKDIFERINFEVDNKINPNDLDGELIRIGQTASDYILAYGEAIKEKRRLQKKRNVLKAKIGKQIRDENQKKKPTEKAIEEMITLHPKIIKIEKLYTEAVANEAIMQEAKNNILHVKKKSIEILCEREQAGLMKDSYSEEIKQRRSLARNKLKNRSRE